MSYRVKSTTDFDKAYKRILKKHKGIKSDLAKLISELEINPTLGIDLGRNLYKIRLAISGTNKGKSGGARVITYIVVANETVYLSDIYLKSEHDSINTGSVIDELKQSGII